MSKSDRQFLNWVLESAVVIGLVTWLGKWLDSRLATGANCLALLLLLGFGLEGYSLYKIIKSAEKK
ncbi:hypothetical protein NO2_0759 [Candidatus Termititenax persephonae]|uniref:Uncharacterized protein n=1 Tax=Candidatus Termititenax persephonae TaxID=2218525 RepID=A0A388TGE1_9BACT|nr:hypothetical protein NO2_0759 [Candidatus Termititenax persephonae]